MTVVHSRPHWPSTDTLGQRPLPKASLVQLSPRAMSDSWDKPSILAQLQLLYQVSRLLFWGFGGCCFVFVSEIMGVRSAKREKNTWDRKQSDHNAFTMLFPSPFSYQYLMVQPDSPSILAVCLSKRLHGTGWCDSLVDILSVFHYEKKAGFPCNLFFSHK